MNEEALLFLLQKKKGLFLAILDLTKTEYALTPVELEKVLQQKKILLACIEKIDHQIKDFRHAFVSVLPQDIQEELTHIRKVITQILKTDKLNYAHKKKELGIYD
ncbi:hypothetical protein [Candidatus Chlamydia sanziniae]|uniref:Uncharacterized protein n=1 Tax=Candidatus Chlamydia sanziniae TaxID=1806891 RepID=A0A1A9HWA7_9CHLA|nr:hypothetical protein [Candidatus Chlamydia sanziniae]ANH78383.1 hypothetical protein Cs308_0212 [Candidatus Chlamydia sanziniae]